MMRLKFGVESIVLDVRPTSVDPMGFDVKEFQGPRPRGTVRIVVQPFIVQDPRMDPGECAAQAV